MPSYKLVYFDLRARAEPVRIMFELAGVKYEDVRIPFGSEEWQKMKPTIGLGQVPVLEVDGKEMPQSGAIYRYVAREHGMIPLDSWEIAQMDVVIETVKDMAPGMGKVFLEKDPAKKEFATEGCQPVLNNMEKLLKKNNGGAGWFVGDKITLADVLAFSMVHDAIPPLIGVEPGDLSYMKSQDALKAFVDRFKVEPKVAAWLQKRPKNVF
ncbi:S-crystallin SL11 [Holothuria leucospilota]|uniref:S-crystallin SL11 n=1 Tax=Holothuria leucospilota TaxID=206669 RepID=A0A9Q0YFX6_HOLLE|nr:S-crystallin SL11 [Holothuria leucospilota]